MIRRLLNTSLKTSSSTGIKNTYIGGVGSEIPTVNDFVTLTQGSFGGLQTTDVENYEVDGQGNVSMHVISDYTIEGINFFYNNPLLTDFIDREGRLKSVSGAPNGILSGSSLKYLYLPSFQRNNSRHTAFNCPELLRANVAYDNSGFSDSRTFSNCDKLERIELKNTTALLQNGNNFYAFDLMNGLKRVYMPLVQSASAVITKTSKDASRLNIFNQSINSGFQTKFYINQAMGVQSRNAFLNLNSSNWQDAETFSLNGLTYTAVLGIANEGEFDVSGNSNTTNLNIVNAINNDTRIGIIDPKPVTAEREVGIILNATTAGQAFANSIQYDFTASNRLVENNINGFSGFIGGNDCHPFVMYAKYALNWEIIPLNSQIPVNAPSNLTYSNLTQNSVQLNFTEPTPNSNGTDVYEVWIDDGTTWRSLFYYEEIAGTGTVLDLTDVVNDVGGLSNVKIKIRTMDGQMNYSVFSNDITLP